MKEKKGLKTMEDFLNSKLLLNAILLKKLVKENKNNVKLKARKITVIIT